MKFRQGLNLNRENFSDTPDFYWAEPELEGSAFSLFTERMPLIHFAPAHFNSLSDALDVKARAASVNEKITYAAEVCFQNMVYADLLMTNTRRNPYCDNSSPR
jgi:uncharacterized Rmd1/YagE family protein